MRILRAEFQKALTVRFFSVLIIAVVANFFLFRHNLSSTYSFYTQTAYISAQRDVMAMEPERRLPYLRERVRLLDACIQWETEAEPVISKDTKSYWDSYTSGTYLLYTDEIYSERFLFRDLLWEVQQIDSHSQVILSILEEARAKTSVSIFTEPDSFSYRDQVMIVARFQDLLRITPTYDMSAGVVHFQASALTDLIGLISILLFCTEVAVRDQTSGTLPILKTTANGRLPLIGAKLVCTAVLSFLIVGFLWGANLCYCWFSFGLGDLTRPVQSLPGFSTCALTLTVGEYLILFFLLKWVLYTLVGMLCLTAGIFWQKTMPTWLTVGTFLSVGYILSKVISPISAWNILKFANISTWIFSTQWLSEYRNLNILGYPVSVFTFSWVLICVILITVPPLLCSLFCRAAPFVMPQPRFRLPKWVPLQGRSTSLFGHELWKILWECGAMGVLILLLLINLQAPRAVSYDTNELHCRNYMEQLSGPLTEEKRAYLEAEAMRFSQIRQRIAQLRKAYASGELSETELNGLLPPLERAVMAEQVLLERVYPQLERILQLENVGNEAWFVYAPGYEYLFGLDPRHSKDGSTALVVAGIILCFSNVFPIETSSGTLPILTVSKKGRAASAWCKLTVCMIITVVIHIIAQIPDYRYVLRNYGFPDLGAPLCSIAGFSGWKDTVSILEGLILFEFLRLTAAMCVTAAVLLLGIWSKSHLISLSVSTGILLLPLLLHLLNVPILDHTSFLMPLSGACLHSSEEPLFLSILYYGANDLLGITALVLIIQYAKQGYCVSTQKIA